jgi:hypothetical protein
MDATNNNSSIIMWGPKGSGKTWLLHAFVKELEWYNEKDNEFIYSLKDTDGNIIYSPASINSMDVAPSAQSEDHVWIFERTGRNPKAHGHQVSTHTHRIVVHDNPGLWLTDAVDPQSNFSNGVVTSTLQSSNNIIITLDPTSVKNSPVVTADIPDVPSKADYERWINILLNIILQKHPVANTAVCLSKSDLIKFYLPTDEIIRVVFGEGVVKAFKKPGLNVNFFRVSSVGHIKTLDGKRIANLDDSLQSIKDEARWDPVNVVAPFFWLFENIERQRIKKGDIFGDREKHYIPYPPPRNG